MEKNRYYIMFDTGKKVYKKNPFQYLRFSNIEKAREFLEIVRKALIVDSNSNEYYRQDTTKKVHLVSHPLLGKRVSIISGKYKGKKIKIEDWADKVIGEDWFLKSNNPACMDYLHRCKKDNVVFENTLYGKIGSLGCLINESEIEME